MTVLADKKKFWQQAEALAVGETVANLSTVLDNLCFNAEGLIPVIIQCDETNNVLMLAWMNRQSLSQTVQNGMMTYYSRSRQTLWRKGETSGCYQKLCHLFIDCDGDTLLARVKQLGDDGACHTKHYSCFYITVNDNTAMVITTEKGDK